MFLAHSSSLPAGEYDFEVTSDGQVASCTATFAAKVPEGTCSSASGIAVSVTPAGFFSLTVLGAPSSVQVVVRSGGATIASRSYVPAYADARPNGPDCPGACREASDTLTLD